MLLFCTKKIGKILQKQRYKVTEIPTNDTLVALNPDGLSFILSLCAQQEKLALSLTHLTRLKMLSKIRPTELCEAMINDTNIQQKQQIALHAYPALSL